MSENELIPKEESKAGQQRGKDLSSVTSPKTADEAINEQELLEVLLGGDDEEIRHWIAFSLPIAKVCFPLVNVEVLRLGLSTLSVS